MTRKKVSVPSAAMIEEICGIVCDELAGPVIRRRGVMLAFELGKAEGRAEGAQSVVDRMDAAARTRADHDLRQSAAMASRVPA